MAKIKVKGDAKRFVAERQELSFINHEPAEQSRFIRKLYVGQIKKERREAYTGKVKAQA